MADESAFRLDGKSSLFRESAAAYGHRGAVRMASLYEAFRKEARSSCSLVIGCDEFACGRQVTDEGRAFGDGIKVID